MPAFSAETEENHKNVFLNILNLLSSFRGPEVYKTSDVHKLRVDKDLKRGSRGLFAANALEFKKMVS
jgi:hypothetical protein